MTTADGFETLCCSGYTSLAKNPEVLTACRKIANIVSSMTLYLMSNGKNGDKRIVNELSKAVDICPNSYMTRKTFMDAIVMNLLLHGRGNSIVLPHTHGGLLASLEPIAASRVTFVGTYSEYQIYIDGVPHDSEDVVHFVYNPDSQYLWKGVGLTTALKDVAHNLRQAGETKKAFMESKWQPSIIVKVDALIDEFSNAKGREKLLESYISTAKRGEPWMIPAEQFDVVPVKPLSLADLAINDAVKIDKQTVASVIGVPPFVLGVGVFKQQEWNNFIDSTIAPIAKIIEQELTKKLLLNPKWYWKFNVASLYSYDLKMVADTYGTLYDRGVVTGNEVRDKVNLSPREGLDKLHALENYIPVDDLGKQKKLKGAKDDEKNAET